MFNFRQGAMTFGEEGADGVRVSDIKVIEEILNVFHKHGHTEVSSFPRIYQHETHPPYSV